MNYDNLENVDIFSTGFFNSNNYLIFELFSKFNIKSLKDFFLLTDKFFVKNPFDIVKDLVPFWYTLSDCEVKGLSDLLKYVYLDEELNIDDILKSNWIKCDVSKINTLYLIKRIRILGFSEMEFNNFVSFANDLDNELSIGDILCLLNQTNIEDKVFSKKVGIFSEYYSKLIEKKSNLTVLKELYEKLNRQLEKRNNIDIELKKTYLDIENMLKYSENDKEVVELSKRLNGLDIK